MKRKKFLISDWAGNILDFRGKFMLPQLAVAKSFDSFDDAWSFLYEKYPNEECFDDFYVLPIE